MQIGTTDQNCILPQEMHKGVRHGVQELVVQGVRGQLTVVGCWPGVHNPTFDPEREYDTDRPSHQVTSPLPAGSVVCVLLPNTTFGYTCAGTRASDLSPATIVGSVFPDPTVWHGIAVRTSGHTAPHVLWETAAGLRVQAEGNGV